MPLTASDLLTTLQAVAPSATGVRIKQSEQKSSWIIMFADGSEWSYGSAIKTTDQQAAETVIRDWDFNAPPPPSLEERLATLEAKNQTLRDVLVQKGVVSEAEVDVLQQPVTAAKKITVR